MTVVSQASISSPGSTGSPISTIAISPQDENYRIVGLQNGQVWATSTGSSTLVNITGGSFPTNPNGSTTNKFVGRAMIDPNNKNVGYVTFSFFAPAGQGIWKITNLGAAAGPSPSAPAWSAAGNAIPSIPINAFAIDPANSNNLFAGTDIGVYNSTDGGANWAPFGAGLPRVAVFDMSLQNANRVLRAGTHGRGVWEISIATGGPTPTPTPAATGIGSVLLSSDQTSEQASLVFSHVAGVETAADIDGPAGPGVSGPLLFSLPTANPVTNFQIGGLTTQQVADLRSGLHYMNVHSSNFPNGEIRGQLLWNPTLEESFFVNQHYYDFLQRIPDAGGLAYWTGQISQCQSDPQCLHDRTIVVSNAFFFELEYQQTGAYVYRLFRAAFGNDQPSPNPDPLNPREAYKIPSYEVYVALRARVVGGSDLATGQQNAANILVNGTDFLAKYPASLTLDRFVDAVLLTIQNDIGVDLSSQRAALVALGSRSAVMYHLANDDLGGGNGGINNRAFIDAEYNRSFVITQYFGYLRRDGDIFGILFWLRQLNSAPLRDTTKQNAMVCSFITSAEYQQRFGPNVPRTNAECPQ